MVFLTWTFVDKKNALNAFYSDPFFGNKLNAKKITESPNKSSIMFISIQLHILSANAVITSKRDPV